MTTNGSSGRGRYFTFSIIIFAILIGYSKLLLSAADDVNIPLKFRSEGQLFMDSNYVSGKHNQHHIPFVEFVDSEKLRSAVTIGYVSHPPANYYRELGSPMIIVSEGESCNTVENSTNFVPPIAWFADVILPAEKPDGQDSTIIANNIGPTGLYLRLLDLQKNIDPTEIKSEEYNTEHRYTGCHVQSRKFRIVSKRIDYQLDIYTPITMQGSTSNERELFTIKATIKFYERSVDNIYNWTSTTMTLKYLSFRPVGGFKLDGSIEGPHFQLPLGRGCSKYLKQIEPNFGDVSSFSFNFKQLSARQYIKLSYDNSSALLQRETPTSERSIWDLGKNLWINLGWNSIEALYSSSLRMDKLSPCAIINIEDTSLKSAFRPNQNGASQLDLKSFAGASRLAYMGPGSVRDLPCSIYESIVPEAPAIFGLIESEPGRVNDYIVQFHLHRTKNIESILENNLTAVDFKPLRLTLLRRLNNGTEIEEAEELEVHDFSWSLDTEGGQLFDASDCFGAHAFVSEQLNLEVALAFDRLEPSTSIHWLGHLWPWGKPKLERELLNDLLKSLGTNRLNIVDYNFHPNAKYLELRVDLADWAYQPKKISLIAEGKLSSELVAKIRQEGAIRYRQLSEYVCLARGSVIKNTSRIIFCDEKVNIEDVLEGSYCIIMLQNFDQDSNLINGFTPMKELGSNEVHCRAYEFEELAGSDSRHPMGGLKNVSENRSKLDNHLFEFNTKNSTGYHERWRSRVKSFELKQNVKLQTIDNYAFQKDWLEADDMHTFESMENRNLDDCKRMCDLDISCRSYSFCLAETASTSNCIMSALDLRASKIREQIDRKQSKAKNITVHGHALGIGYNLTYDKCCKIHERNYLDIFGETEELIWITKSNANRFPKANTTFGCAQLSSNSLDQNAMFAYCASSNLCLLDENLFQNGDNNSSATDTNFDLDDEIACRVYRKRYQSFYRVSSQVVKQASLKDNQQLQLDSVNSVESCARFCLEKSEGQCKSFDFCEPGKCLINKIILDSKNIELKSGCLHYERDQKRSMKDELETNGLEVDGLSEGTVSILLTYSVVVVASLLLGMRLADRFQGDLSDNSIMSALRRLFSLSGGYRATNESGSNSSDASPPIAMSLFQREELILVD